MLTTNSRQRVEIEWTVMDKLIAMKSKEGFSSEKTLCGICHHFEIGMMPRKNVDVVMTMCLKEEAVVGHHV